MKKFEYKIESFHYVTQLEMLDILNESGLLGWQAVGIHEIKTINLYPSYTITLMREIK